MTAAVTCGSFSSHSAILPLKESSLLERLRERWSLRRRFEVFADRSPAHFEMALDFADGPVFGPVKPVQVVDLFGVEHRLVPLCGRIGGYTSRLLFARWRHGEPGGAEVLRLPRLAPELSCCLQDRPRRGRRAKPAAAECFRSRAEVLFARLQQALLPVAELLLLAVSVGGGGILLPILLPVIGIAGAPFSGTVPADLAVFGIGGDFGAVIIGAATALAVGSAADGLAGLELRRLEDLLAVEATPFTHMNGVVSSRRHDWPLAAAEFRNCCRVATASPPMASAADYIAGENAVVLNRG